MRPVAAGDSLVIERPAPQVAGAAAAADLTPREREVLGLVARGLANGEIAAALVIGSRR